nr:hypothetical protein [Tanacetum cinerariifolium]
MKGKRKCDDLNNKPLNSDNVCGNDVWNEDFGNVSKRQQYARRWMQNPSASYDNNMSSHGLGNVGGSVVLGFESSAVRFSSTVEDLRDFGESSTTAATRRCDIVISNPGQVVLDFESSAVLMPSTNGGIQPLNLCNDACSFENSVFCHSTRVNICSDLSQQIEVESTLGQHCAFFASQKRRKNVNNQHPINVDAQDQLRTDFSAHKRRCFGVQRRHRKWRAIDQHVQGRPAVTEDIGSNTALHKGVSSLCMDIEYVQYETKKALRNGKVYNWETATYCKIKYIEDINDLKFFKTKFPAIVYVDALNSEFKFSSEPTNSFDCPPDSYHPPHPTYETYSGDTCGNDSHFGYDCPPRFPLNYKPEPRYIQNYNSYPHDSSSFPQQYPCCEDCGVTHEPYQCQPKNHDYYHEQNSCCESNSIGFDQFQSQQYTVNHPIFNAHNEYLDSHKKLTMTLTTVTKQMTSLTSICELTCQIVQKKLEEKQLEEEKAAKAQSWKLPVCYDDDDDEESSNSLEDNIISELPQCVAITPNEPVDSLSMGDEHLNTIPATE